MAFYHTVKENGEFSCLLDNGGRIMGEQEWNELKEYMDAFYQQNSDASIREYNASATERRMAAVQGMGKSEIQKPKGYVYFIAYEYHGVKIGYTRNLQARFKQLQIASPFPLTLIGSIETYEPQELETYLHQYFKNNRINGEWFRLGESEVFEFINKHRGRGDNNG